MWLLQRRKPVEPAQNCASYVKEQVALGEALMEAAACESGTELLSRAVVAFRNGARASRDTASTQLIKLKLAATLVRLGEREIATTSLEAAIAVLRDALSRVDRRTPPDFRS